MAFSALSLSTTTGVQGRPYRAVLSGTQAGSTYDIGGDGSPGFSIVNGRVSSSALPYATSTLVIVETRPGEGRNTTRFDISAAGAPVASVATDGTITYSGAGGAAAAQAVNATAAGPVYTVPRLLGSSSTLALITGTNANLTINATTGVITAASAIAVGASQTAVVSETNGSLRMDYPVVVTGVSSGVTPTPTPTLSGTLLGGQSQPVRMFARMPTVSGTNASLGVAISPNAKVLARYTDDNRTLSTPTLGVPSDGGDFDSTFAAEYTRIMEERTGRPQLLAGHAVGATTISQWQPGQQYHTELLGVISLMPVGFDRAIFFLGGTDAGAGTTAAAFKAGLSGYFDSLPQYNKPANAPFQKIVLTMGTRLAAGAGNADQVQTIRKAAKEWCAANNGIYLEPHDVVLAASDAVHQGQEGNITLARAIARAALAGADNSPTLTTGSRATTAITLSASAALTQVGNPANRFAVFNSGTSSGALAIASMSVSGATITLNLSADPGSTQALDVYWLRHPDPSGTTAATNMLFDSYAADGLPAGRHLMATTSGPVAVAAPGGTPTPTPTPSASLTDTFTAADGTAVTSRNADTGQAWSFNGADWSIQSNRARPTANGAEILSAYTPASANYFVSADFAFVSVASSQAVYLEGRFTTDGTNSTAYFFGYRQATGGWIIGKTVAGTFTVLVSVAYAPTTGDVKNVRGEMNSAGALRLLVDGAQVLTTTDTTITAVGKVAARSNLTSTATTGIHLDNLNAGALT